MKHDRVVWIPEPLQTPVCRALQVPIRRGPPAISSPDNKTGPRGARGPVQIINGYLIDRIFFGNVINMK